MTPHLEPTRTGVRALLAGLTGALVLALAPAATAAPAPGDPAPEGSVVIDVVSDVQGDTADLARVLRDQAAMGLADHLVVNGDLVPTGTQEEYDALRAAFDANPHPASVSATIGNHETYTGEDSATLVGRFLQNTGMPAPWSLQDVQGVPLVHLGTTATPARTPEGEWSATLGDEQLAWFDATLDALPADAPVLVFSHHPLPRSVSGTGFPGSYTREYRTGEAERLRSIMSGHPNVLFLTGHTHYDLRDDNWLVDAGGFTAVNTGSVQTTWERDATGEEVTVDEADHSGLRLTVGADRVRVQAYDFETDELLHDVDLPLPTPGL